MGSTRYVCGRLRRWPKKPPNFRHFHADKLCSYAGIDAFREHRPQCSAENRVHRIDLLFGLCALVKQKEYLRRRLFEPTISRITITVQRNPLLPRPD
jgi:hypothetical protein